MSFTTLAATRAYAGSPKRGPVTRLLEDERWLAMLLLLPTLALLGLFIAYPFIEGVRLSVTDAKVGVPGHFVGLKNFEQIWNDDIFHVAVWNTCVYTAVATVFKLALGLWLALLLNHHFKGKAITRAFILLPFIIPTVLSTLAWKWMFDPTFSVINWMLFRLGVIHSRINWLGDPNLALISVIIVNVWRGVPFYAISLLAGLQTISPELHEAAAIDGARAWQRFWHVTWPLLLPVTLVIVLFSVIQTFADFQLVYVLTGGGPANATQLFATYAYQIGIGTGLLESGRDDFARGFPGAFARCHRPAALHPPGGDPLSDGRGRALAALGLFLHSVDRLHRRAAVSVLLDDHHQHPAGQRALSAVERTELPPFWTTNPTLEHIRDLLTETLFSTWMLNTMIISLAATAISLFCGLLAGYALSRLKFPFAGSLGTMIFITYLVPQTLLFIPLADIIRNFHLGDSPWALILTYPTFLIPFVTWLMMGYFKSIPKELEECARIDGATRWKAMVYIIFPIAVPGILSAGIFAFTLSWNEFHLRPGLPLLARAENGSGRRDVRADPRRRVLLG